MVLQECWFIIKLLVKMEIIQNTAIHLWNILAIFQLKLFLLIKLILDLQIMFIQTLFT